MANIVNSYEEPERWRASRKLTFKQISIGLNRIINYGVPDHLNQLRDNLRQAAQLTTESSSTWTSGVTWDDEASLCRSQIQQSLSTLMQDLRSLDEMMGSVRDEEIEQFKELAVPCCQRVHKAVRDARQVITALEKHQVKTTVCQSNQISPSTSSGFEDFDEQDAQPNLEQEQLLVDSEMLRERSFCFEALARDIDDLKEMMNCMNAQVVQDGETVQRIDSHVENAVLGVSFGEKMLRQARHLKTAALPATFATVGFVAGGPIGAVAGVRVGIAASLVGTAVGYMGGKFLHNTNKFIPPMFRPRMPTPQAEPEPAAMVASEPAPELTSAKKLN